MGIATARPIFFHHSSNKLPLVTPRDPSDHPLPALKSMSENYSPSFFNIRDSSFEPSNDEGLQHDQFQRAAQQIRCDKMRLRGFEPMVEIHQEEGEEGMLSEMFNFPVSGSGCSGGGTVELLLDHSAVPFPSLLPPPRPLPPPPNQFTFGGGGYNSEIGCSFIQSQGLSLSLSSSLQHLEAARASDGLLLFNGQGANISPVASFIPQNSHKPWFEIQRQDHRPAHVGYGSQLLVVNVLRTSKYFKAAKELLEEFCSVGRGHLKKAELRRSTNPSPQCLSSSSGKNNHSGDAGGGGVSSSSSSRCRENPPLSAADRMEHQRRKVRLLSMLDEVDGRYSQYCEQMQMVVTSFDLVMGFGSAVPYTALAQKAMSRHFRCLRDAVEMQLKHSCNLLGEKDSMGTSGITRGETPRLKLLDQSFRRRRVLQDAGIMPEQEVWRPQRGLPERSIDILRAWLFENFLHPYPSEADKHLLARQTGLSKNQVANWFINARVRLWKPMVEEMYQQEAKDEEEGDRDYQRGRNPSSATNTAAIHSSQNPTATAKTTEIFAPESDPSIPSPISQDPSKAPPQSNSNGRHPSSSAAEAAKGRPIQPGLGPGRQLQKRRVEEDASCPSGGFSPDYGLAGDVDISSALIKLGASAGDVSLTLGLQHAGNFGLIN